MIRIILIIITLNLAKTSFSQYTFSRSYDINVNEGSTQLNRAWEGGLNYPIFSNIDFDNDGKIDLVAFDKSGKRLLLFNHNDLKFQPINTNLILERWVLFRDFNCDGFYDIFTATTGGIRVYKNTGNMSFILEKSILQSDYINFTSNLYVSNLDIPGIVDIDGDGDLDVLTFDINGISIEYHENLSMDKFQNCNELQFNLNTKCWGEFTENATTNNINLNQPCGSVNDQKKKDGKRHMGSTITTLDQNKDGDIEIILGDISFNNLVYLNNGGSNSNAIINTTSNNFPDYSNSFNINTFPYVSYADVNFDGKNDLIGVSNSESSGDNKKVVLHKNIGVLQDTFSFETNEFLINEMLDFGAGAYPVLIDENQDGLLDLLVGNSGEKINGNQIGKLALLRNTGSVGNPAFELINDDYLNLSNNNLTYIFPTVGDIDGDGDNDLFIGLENGKIAYYNNTAGIGNTANFVLADGFFNSIDIGNFAAPQLFDVNEDNLLDLIIGEQEGSLTLFTNQGTANNAIFNVEEKEFGGITTQDFSTGAFHGFSTPHLFKDADTTRILVGSEDGGVYYYKNIDSLQMGKIVLTSKDFARTKDGGRSSVITHDLNNDMYLDLFIGNLSGGIAYHKGEFHTSVNPVKYTSNIKYRIVKNQLEISNFKFDNFLLYSITGKLIEEGKNTQNKIILNNINNGVYLVILMKDNERVCFKFMK